MVEPGHRDEGAQYFRPRARILRTVGDELISSETVAIMELVKNAYDADATRVLVRFKEPLEAGRGGVDVLDNGHGMSLDTVRTTWMEPATSAKRRRSRSDVRKRRLLGEKGIGRFAASKLATSLEVVTRRAGAAHEVRVFFDWRQFDDDQKYLDEVEVRWQETPPSDICAEGDMRSLWEVDEQTEGSAMDSGTILLMWGLTVTWDEEQLRGLRLALSRLVSPFLTEEQVDDEFRIYLRLPPGFEGLSGRIEPPEALMSPPYYLRGNVDATGRYDLEVRVGEEEQALQGRFKLRHHDGPPRCGPFGIELRVWDRDRTAMGELAREYGSTLNDVRRDLNEAAGINVYRDGFRVLPYGEPRNDWLRLDLRRVQNPARLSNNQIVGYVLISSDKNPQLRDQSNREGLIEGPALEDLRELVKLAMTELEKRRARTRRDATREERQTGGLFTDFDLGSLRDLIKQRYPEDTELLRLVGEKGEDLEKRVEQVQEVVSRYRRLATLGQLIDTVLHDGRAPLAKIRNEAFLGTRDIERSGDGVDGLAHRLKDRFGVVDRQSGALATVFRKIEPFGGRKRGRPARIRLEQVIADAFSVLEGEIAKVGVQVSLPQTETTVTVDQAEVQEVLINLLQNSLYWLRQVPQDAREIAVKVNRADSGEVKVLFSDSGPGVELEFRDTIFDPYFSAKPDGTGLGLTIAGEIVKEHYDGVLGLIREGPLPGATFEITLRRV